MKLKSESGALPSDNEKDYNEDPKYVVFKETSKRSHKRTSKTGTMTFIPRLKATSYRALNFNKHFGGSGSRQTLSFRHRMLLTV